MARFNPTIATALAAGLLAASAQGTISDWSQVQWLSWTPSTATTAVGSLGGSQVSASVSGTNSIISGAGTSFFDVQGNATFSMATPTLGLGNPRANGVTFYTFNFTGLNVPVSSLVLGFTNLDAFNGRGSITLSAVDTLSAAVNVNLWTVEAQFKEQAGLPSAQALVTLAPVNTNNVRFGSMQAVDNTSWGDSRGIFLTGLPDNLASLTLAHQYNHPNPTVSDSIGFYVGVVPEPSSALACGGAVLALLALRRRKTSS